MAGVASAPVRVGLDESFEDVYLDVVRDHHVLVAGMTRSGKSSLAYGLLGGLQYGEVPVRVVGIDPTSVLLKPFADDPLVVLGTWNRLTVAETLESILEICRSRMVDLGHLGVDRLSVVSRSTPTILVVLEEWQELLDTLSLGDRALKPADRIRPRVEAALDALVAGGAKVQVKVLLLTQRASSKRIDTDSRANFGSRICLRVEDDESAAMLFPGLESGLSRRLQGVGPGIGVVKSPGTSARLFRVDHVTYQEYLDATRGEF